MKDKIKIRKKFGPYFLLFYIITTLIFVIFPKQLVGNINIIIAYLIGCLLFIYLLNRYKRKINN